MAKKKNKLVLGYYDANTGTRVTNANIVEDSSGWRIEKNKLDNLNTQSSVMNSTSPITRSKILAPTPQETMTRNNINNIAIKNIVSGGLQNDIHNLNMSQATKINNTKIDLSGKDKSGGTTPFDLSEFIYNDTGKKYGDYYYDNYELYKDMPIYEQKGKYYLKTNRGYEPIGRLDKNGNVIENLMTNEEAERKDLEKAQKLGYKDNLTKITTQDYDDAQETFKKLQKEYKLSDKELNDWLKTGDLDLSHISLQTNSMSNLRNKAEDYREKINSGKIKQYDQQGFGIENQIYLDTQNLSDIEKQQYISYITGKKDKTQKNNNTFFKGSSVFDDGYQFGDVTKATLGTIGNAGISLAKGVGKFVEGTGDFATNLVGSGLELMASDKDKKDVKEFHNNTWNIGYKYGNKNYWYDEKNDRLYDENWNRVYNFDINKMQKRYTYANGVAEFGRQMKEQTVNDDTSEVFDEMLHGNDLRKMSVLGNKSEGMLESLGQAIPLMAAGGSVGGLYGESAAVATTSGLTFTSTYGKAKEEAIRNGATEKEAMQTAFVQATAETISEQFFDAIPGAKSAGWGEKLVGKIGKGVENYFGSTTGKIVMKALDISGEGFEEVISNMLTAGGNDIVHFFDKDYSYGMENQTGNILDDMSKAMVSQDSMDSFVSAIITSAILNGGSSKVNSAKINKIVKAYAQEHNMSIKEAKVRLKISDNNIEFDTRNINQTQNTSNLPNNLAVERQNTNNNINNQINNNIEISMPTTQNNTNEKYSNVNPPIVIKYQETDNQKINTFRQSAVKEGMLNSKKTTDAMNVIEKIIQDKDYNVKFDRTITNLEGKSVDGKISINKNGEVEIALNPNSDRAVEFLLTHEVTHAIETKELRGIILDYANKNSEFKSALQDLQKTYGTTNVNDEVIADISGQILGNQEFINSLSMQNTEQSRGFISKVYHSIQRLLNKLTTKGRYRNFVEDLETKWREAYRLATNETAVNNLKNDSKYMMTSVKGMNNGINTDNKYLDIKKRYDKAQKLKDSGLYSNEDIRQETGWFQDKEGNWEFEISDHNNDFKINPQPNTKYKMSNLFEAKTLYDLYPGLKDINVIFKKLPKHKSGNYNMETNEITINNNNLDNIDDIRGTLLHEMQHYIQKVEGLPRGTTILFGNEQYANSKGEIEAADTKRRMKMSVKERKQIIPESSKKNPIHPNRENILNHKRGIIEKIAEKMYNKFGVDTNENIEEEVKENYSKTDNKNFNTYQKYKNGIEELDNSSFSLKEKQLEIIKKNNPVEDDYHTWIRNIDDIKTLSETLEDSDWEGYDEFNPDLTRQDILEAIDNGEIMVYSSYPIEQGTFISPSKMEAESYSGNGKVYSKKVSIDDVAWIDPTQGQYAKVSNESNSSKVVDNQGRTLSKEQQEYFKDSKVRDKNGNLLTMYHGTPNGNFTEFNPGSYFSSNENYANNYQDENASILKQNKGVSNKKTYQVYLNITNPFELSNSVARDIYINEFIKGGNSGYFDPYTSYNDYVRQFNDNDGFEWLEAEDLKEWVLENHPEFDGLVVQEVPDNVDPDAVNLAYIPFNSNQIKNVDNLNPTENNDIRYSQKSSTWQEHLENNYKPTGTRTYFDEITYKKIAPLNPNAITKQNKVKPPIAKQYQKNTIEEKIETSSIKSISNATKIANKYLDLSREERQLFQEKLKKYKNKTYEEISNGEVYNEIKDIVREFSIRPIENIDEEMKSVKREIRNRNIKIDDNLKNQIDDYNEFRKSMFGKLKLTKDGMSIDSLYNELSNIYPYYFDSNITTEADMLYELADFMDKNVVDIQRYNLTEKEIDDCTSKVFNEMKNGLMTDEKINSIKEKNDKKENKLTHKEVKEQLLNDMNITAEDLSVGDDIKSLNFQLTDPIRVNEKVFGRELGKKVNEVTIEKTKHNEAERTRWLNSERDDIKELEIKPRSKESAAVQKYGEKQYVNKYGETVEYGDKELMAEFPNVKTQEKIKRASQMIRNKYDKYIDQINETLTALGYDEIPKRSDYMRHFQELGDIFSQTGVPFNLNDMSAEDLPTDINGLTEFNKPGKNWFASAQKRYGNKTTYDAITGIDGYLEGASNLIFHTEDIQRYRALSGLIRDSFGKTKGFENLDNLSNKEALKRIDDIQHNKLSKYVAWLDEQANSLANKKGAIDRGTERILGRRGYTALNTIKKQVGSNMTGFNVRSAMTNFISSTIAASKTNKIAMIKGTISTIRNMFHNDGFINKSDFLTSRFGSDSLSPKLWNKISNAGQILMKGSDYFTSNQIVRSKYYEGLQKGMTEKEAIKYADDFGSRVMGDRSKGATAEAFNSKTLGLLTQFQLETNNQWQFMVHDSIMDYEANSKINGGLKAGATMLFQLGQLCAYSYFFNEFFEALTGSRAAFDPIDILLKLLGWGDDDKDKSFEQRMKEANSELVDAIPFASLFGKGGRMPISEALVPFETTYDYLTGKKNSYGGNVTLEDVKNDTLSTLPYYLLPTGYSQIKKTTKGLSMFNNNKEIKGSYTKSGRLRFPVKDTIGNKIQAGLFGEYASKEAREYFSQNRKPLTDNQQNIYKYLDIPISDYWKINKDINNLKSELKGKDVSKRQEEIFDYIDNLDISQPRKDILKKLQYKSYKDGDNRIIKYINSSNMSTQAKKEILKKLGLDK